MSAPPKYNAQMIFLDRAERAGEVRAYAELSRTAISDLLRDAHERGWPQVRAVLRAEHGEPNRRQHQVGILLSLRGQDRPAYAERHGIPADATPGELWEWAARRRRARVAAE